MTGKIIKPFIIIQMKIKLKKTIRKFKIKKKNLYGWFKKELNKLVLTIK